MFENTQPMVCIVQYIFWYLSVNNCNTHV